MYYNIYIFHFVYIDAAHRGLYFELRTNVEHERGLSPPRLREVYVMQWAYYWYLSPYLHFHPLYALMRYARVP